MRHGIRIFCAAFLSLFASGLAHAICDANVRHDTLTAVAYVVIEDVAAGDLPGQMVATMRVRLAVKGTQPAMRMSVSSQYNQAEVMKFPAAGEEFYLRAVGGPGIYRTNACLYAGGPLPFYKSDEPFPADILGWCDRTICQNLRFSK
jgi:hypothetical protein